jgi:succinate-acetate transporter protein
MSQPAMERELPPRIVLRPVGHPLPLGFLALAVGSLVLSALQLGWIAPTEGRVAALTALGFTAPLQLLAAVLGFQARDTIAGTGMGLLSGTWAVIGIVMLTSPPGATSDGLGVMLLGAGLALSVPAVCAGRKLAAAAVLGTASLRFAVTGIAQLGGLTAWSKAAGLVGLLLALLAVYAAAAFALEDLHERPILPLFRRGPVQRAAAGQVTDQLDQLSHEPGVRAEL